MQSVRNDLSSLIDVDNGLISREVFSNEEIYQQEMERIFAKSWLYVGHVSQVPEPGNYVLSKMGGESVILTRDRKQQIHVLQNSCRHRGMAVCRYDEGKTERFYCPFHGWSFGIDGELKHATQQEASYGASFDKKDWGLIPAAKLAIRHGLVWATWDARAPSFEEFLGGAVRMLDLSFVGWDGESEIEVLGSTQKWIIPANWKLIIENFAGDGLHDASHQSANTIGVGPSDSKGRRDAHPEIMKVAYPHGHGGTFFDYRGVDRQEYGRSKITAEYFLDTLAKRRRVMGEDADIAFGVGAMFPNLTMHGYQPRTLMVINPLGAGRSELWRSYFVDKNAPAEVKKFLRAYYLRYSGPAGMVEQDDIENWGYATAAAKGLLAKKLPYNYQAGISTAPESVFSEFPGGSVASSKHIGFGPTFVSDMNARIIYKRWLELMSDQEPASANGETVHG